MGSLGDPSPALSRRPRILFIDAYDSFSNNITSQLTTLLDVDVFVLPIDSPISKEEFRHELRHYEAVVCGPGPGSPENEADVGLMRWLWSLDRDDWVPVLGVCLGFQSLVLACGGRIRRLRRGLHGMVRPIQHRSKDKGAMNSENIFNGVGSFKATLYHSLCADIGQDSVGDWDRQKWNSPPSNPDIIPLAWVEEDRDGTEKTERILMALKHRTTPFWGLQYHPESVCTEVEGNRVVQNWLAQALRWNLENRRIVSNLHGNTFARGATRPSLLQGIGLRNHNGLQEMDRQGLSNTMRCQGYECRSLCLPEQISVPDIAEVLNSGGTNRIILDSANGDQPPPDSGVDVRGRFSIIAVDVDCCLQIKYHTSDRFVTIVNGSSRNTLQRITLSENQTVWQFLAQLHESRKSVLGLPKDGSSPDENEIPFLGGFVGYITYEQGLSDINVPLAQDRGHKRPDVCLAWVSKSVVIDHRKRLLHIQSLEADLPWIEQISQNLINSSKWCHKGPSEKNGLPSYSRKDQTVVQLPSETAYEANVRTCQEHIAAGESYELCLTDQTRITRTTKPQKNGQRATHPEQSFQEDPSSHFDDMLVDDSSWHLYRTLRRRNPAPFASYIRLGGATLVSSSPERFLHYNRSGLCSMKPMKGTVKKSSEPGDGYPTTLAEAEAILHIPKEEAENLMIVDLVRHDLHGICGAGRVTVPELLKVEEYQTVYTMITTVQGQLPEPRKVHWSEQEEWGSKYSGLDVLSASLPPGSMTGAPKKRSCEILQQIEEGKERSLYSGVVGYMCVTGRGDWSVTIRSMFRWDDEIEADAETGEEKEVWHIGAGGAVTILSTPEGEREEMFVKLARPLSIFTEDI